MYYFLPKDIYFQIMKEQLYLTLFFIIMAYLVNWIVIIKLGLIINNNSFKIRKIIFPWATIGVIYSLFGKNIIPEYLYFFTTLILLTLFLKIITGVNVVKTFFTALISFFMSIVSMFLFGQPLLISDLKLIFSKPVGIIVGSLIEIIIPIIMILILRKRKSPKEKVRSKSFSLIFYVFFLFIAYYFLAIIYYILINSNNYNLWIFISEWLLICITFLVFLRLRVTINKEQQKRQEDQSNYLLETIFSKQREYRNYLQVIKSLVECRKTSEITEYIDQILAEMPVADDFDCGENPILASLLISEQIKARENGIKITAKSGTSLSKIKNAIQIYQILKEVLQYFIEREKTIVTDDHRIEINIKEEQNYYLFEVKGNARQPLFSNSQMVDYYAHQHGKLQSIEKIIKEIHGEYCYLVINDELVGFNFKMPKETRKRFWFPLFFDN